MPRSALGWINLVTPKDGSGAVRRDIAYGPHVRHRLDVYLPEASGAPVPVLFFVYGGGWDSGSKADYSFAGRAFAAAGFLTVIADYRVVPEVHYPDFLKDNAAALNWAICNAAAHDGNPERLFLMGHSAGAYNAVMLGLAGEAYGNIALKGRVRGVVGLSGPYDFYPFDVPASINAFSKAPDPQATQPVNRVTEDAPPMYLGHGTRDNVCGLYNTQNLAAKLREAGVAVVERHYDGFRHAAPLLGLMRPFRWLVPVYAESLAFMRSRLTAAPEA